MIPLLHPLIGKISIHEKYLYILTEHTELFGKMVFEHATEVNMARKLGEPSIEGSYLLAGKKVIVKTNQIGRNPKTEIMIT